jgi:AraC-like DNA-binding protein
MLSGMAKTPMHEAPMPFITLPNWVKAAQQCGFNIEPVFRELKIETDLIHLESATITRTVLEQVMEACIERSKGRHFPFVLGETFAFDYLPDLETFVTTSPTLREAARVFDWVRELINPMIRVELVEQGDTASLALALGAEMLTAGKLPKPYFAESVMAAIVKFGRALLRGEEQFGRVTFMHSRPSYAEEAERHFQMPVAYSQKRIAVELPRALLDARLEGGYSALHQQAELRVEHRLTNLTRPSGLVAAIEDACNRRPELPAEGIDAIAAELGLHARTLQRRLTDEGARFADVLGRVRYRLAIRYLEAPGADVESVSEKLGFSDRRSFTRAFSRWSGVTPSAFLMKKSSKAIDP